jgi:hypothetical protein
VPVQGAASALLSGRGAQIADLDGDGERDVTASVRSSAPGANVPSELLYSVTESGRVRWRISLDDRLWFPSDEYGPPWVTRDLIIGPRDAPRRIAWAVIHERWWPGIVALIDAGGRVTSRFVNAGWLTALAWSRDGRRLLAAGVSNSHRGSVLAVLDASNVSGVSPEAVDSAYRCQNCPPGSPLAYFVFPHSELNALAARTPLEQSLAVTEDGTIVLRIPQSQEFAAAEAIYEFSSALELRRASFSDIYWDWHRRLEGQGKVAHAADRCPDRQALSMRRWDPSTGWRGLQAPAANAQR